ncbi:MAG: hypothetical protein ACT4OE_10820 [Sphingosinicella sp.]
MRTAGERLAAALVERAAALGAEARIETQQDAAWSSVTFDGGRHRLVLVLEQGDAADALAASLATVELELRGHLVADIAVTGQEGKAGSTRLTIAAVTVAVA